MRLVMAGLDYTTADVAVRGEFSPAPGTREPLLRAIMRIATENGTPDISGCALLSTCNRTELYVSHTADVPPDCVRLLCAALGKNENDERLHRRCFMERHERQATEHLMRVAAGLMSSVPGDAQIITQVRSAIDTARNANTADPLIEALFRAAVAAGKKVKTATPPARDTASVAERAVEETTTRLAPLKNKKVLVIGNGTIAILVAKGLIEKGCAVSMTLRDPRRTIDLPRGCAIIDYAERYQALQTHDAVIAATSSPDFILTANELKKRKDPHSPRKLPKLFIDLAVPRDIDPAITTIAEAELANATLLNVDDLRTNTDTASAESNTTADALIREEADRFDLWRRNRRRYAATGAGAPDFPIFINLHRAPVLIAGGGKVAARRAEKLLAAGADVHIVSPEISPEMTKLLERAERAQRGEDGAQNSGALRWTQAPYAPRHMDAATLAIAATDSRDVNAAVGADAKRRGILVSVADNAKECTFYFPAIIKSDSLTAGVVSNNGDHALVKRAAARIRAEMETIDADN